MPHPRITSALPDSGAGLSSELARFCVVGAGGYLLNVGVYAALTHVGADYLPAASGSFAVAVTSNYSWNRLWTFRGRRGSLCGQGLRFLVVALCSLAVNLAILHTLVALHAGELLAQAMAVLIATPLNFLGSRLWAFARSATTGTRTPPGIVADLSRAIHLGRQELRRELAAARVDTAGRRGGHGRSRRPGQPGLKAKLPASSGLTRREAGRAPGSV